MGKCYAEMARMAEKHEDEKKMMEEIISKGWSTRSRVKVLDFCMTSRSQHHGGEVHKSWRKKKMMRGC